MQKNINIIKRREQRLITVNVVANTPVITTEFKTFIKLTNTLSQIQ